jgi:hypothetical protein
MSEFYYFISSYIYFIIINNFLYRFWALQILSDHRDICAFAGTRGVAAILEKAGCDHVKAVAQTEAAFFTDDTKDPSTEATFVGGKFYSDVWVNGGRELANEIIKKNEKETHDAREEAKRAEARCIGIIIEF